MGAHRYQSTWRSLIFNRVYDDSGFVDDPSRLNRAYLNDDYRLESLDLTSVQTLDFREIRQHMEGADPNQSFEGVRMVIGSGLIMGLDAASLEDKTWAMYEAFSPASCRAASIATTPKGVLPYAFKRATVGGSKSLLFYAKPAAGRPVVVGRMREGLSRRFMFQLVATDPFAYDAALTQTTLTGAGGIVTNPGNIYTRPRIVVTMSGAGSASFTIANSTTGVANMVISMSSATAQAYTLDTLLSSYVDAGNVDRTGWISSGYPTNHILVPGANTIALTNMTNVASVRFDFRGAYA